MKRLLLILAAVMLPVIAASQALPTHSYYNTGAAQIAPPYAFTYDTYAHFAASAVYAAAAQYPGQNVLTGDNGPYYSNGSAWVQVGTGASGPIVPGTAGQVAVYSSTGSTVSGSSSFSAPIESFGSAVSGKWDAAIAAAYIYCARQTSCTITFGAKTYAFANQWPAQPVDGSNRAIPITLKGQGSGWNGLWGPVFNGGTVLDLQYAGASSGGKILLTGIGTFAAYDIIFTDSTDSGGAFLYTTNTTLDLARNTFEGIHGFTVDSTAADQDAIILGGTSTTTTGNSYTAAFQGYGTSIRNNFFSSIRRGVRCRTYCNGVQTIGNTVSSTSGTNNSGTGSPADVTPFLDIDGCTGATPQFDVDNVVRDNVIETTYYTYVIRASCAARNSLGPNGFFDASSNTVAMIKLADVIGTMTGTTTANSTSVTGITGSTGFVNGMGVSGIGIRPDTTATLSGTTLTLNRVAYASGSTSISFSTDTYDNRIDVGDNDTAVADIQDNSYQYNFINGSEEGSYSQQRLTSFPSIDYPLVGYSAQFGGPQLSGAAVTISPDYPANAGVPNNTAGAGTVTAGTPMLRIMQSAADGGACLVCFYYNGQLSMLDSAFSAGGQVWNATSGSTNINLNNSSYPTNIGTGSTTGPVTIGGGSDNVVLNPSNGGTATKYVCVDSSNKIVIQASAC
jgi:hypothetical protein